MTVARTPHGDVIYERIKTSGRRTGAIRGVRAKSTGISCLTITKKSRYVPSAEISSGTGCRAIPAILPVIERPLEPLPTSAFTRSVAPRSLAIRARVLKPLPVCSRRFQSRKKINHTRHAIRRIESGGNFLFYPPNIRGPTAVKCAAVYITNSAAETLVVRTFSRITALQDSPEIRFL